MNARVPRRVANVGLLHLKRTAFVGEIVASAAQTFGSFTFSLDDLPNWAEFTSLFQMYRINCVVLKLVPGFSDAAAGQTTRLPTIHMANDYLTLAPWSNANEAFQYQGLVSRRADRMLTWKVTPRALIDAYTGGVSGASIMPKAKQWISTSTGGEQVQHYGVKYFLDAPVLSTALTIKVYATYYLSCKIPK